MGIQKLRRHRTWNFLRIRDYRDVFVRQTSREPGQLGYDERSDWFSGIVRHRRRVGVLRCRVCKRHRCVLTAFLTTTASSSSATTSGLIYTYTRIKHGFVCFRRFYMMYFYACTLQKNHRTLKLVTISSNDCASSPVPLSKSVSTVKVNNTLSCTHTLVLTILSTNFTFFV